LGCPDAPCEKLMVLFLGRIHAVKGVDLLCDAWGALPPHTPAQLLLAGPGTGAPKARLERWVAGQTGPPARYIGPVDGQRKQRLLASAWLLVLPSYSENYGMAVAEALACATPVLTTTETPWREVEGEGCGWVVAPRADSLAFALNEALSLPAETHRAMRVRARAFVARAHSLESAVTRMEHTYLEVIERVGHTGGRQSATR
jgi:glycosyltransferase involved in cell wall biosynthesis